MRFCASQKEILSAFKRGASLARASAVRFLKAARRSREPALNPNPFALKIPIMFVPINAGAVITAH